MNGYVLKNETALDNIMETVILKNTIIMMKKGEIIIILTSGYQDISPKAVSPKGHFRRMDIIYYICLFYQLLFLC